MVFVQMLIGIIVPVFMIILGRINRKNPPEYGGDRIAYSSKWAKASEESWKSANNMFAHLFSACGWNMAIISVVLFVTLIYFPGAGWILCLTLVLIQTLGGIGFSVSLTEYYIRKQYDEEGKLRPIPEVDWEDEWDNEQNEWEEQWKDNWDDDWDKKK